MKAHECLQKLQGVKGSEVDKDVNSRFSDSSSDEDDFLKDGIRRYGIGQWTAILRDPDFTFQDGRAADSLKKRAELTLSLDGIRDQNQYHK